MPIAPQHDAMGAAIRDYFENGVAKPIIVRSKMFDDDEMPVETLFRTVQQMSEIERHALMISKGNTLDVGAGAGCHSLELQNRNIDTTAIDISPLSIETIRYRGVVKAECADFFTWESPETFDTILMLMNGTGIVGTLNRLPDLFKRLDALLAPDGQLLIDSSDLRYIFEDEDGFFDPSEFDHYYGEVDYRIQYCNIKGQPFNWLYVDFHTLQHYAEKAGYEATLLREGAHYDYLARITRKV